jgi:hypothetical protein
MRGETKRASEVVVFVLATEVERVLNSNIPL